MCAKKVETQMNNLLQQKHPTQQVIITRLMKSMAAKDSKKPLVNGLVMNNNS